MSRAAIDMEAEVTMIRPTSNSAATNPKVTVSQAKGMRSRARTPYDMVAVLMTALSSVVHRGGEHIAAMAVVAKHVEAGTGRRQQHRIAGARDALRLGDRRLHRLRALRVSHTLLERRGNGRRVLADQHGLAHLAAKHLGQGREILALALAAGDDHQRARHAATAAMVAPTFVPLESSM